MIRTRLLLGSYIVFLLAACGGNGGGSNNGTPQNNGTDSGTNRHPTTDGSVPGDASDQNPFDNMDSGIKTLPPPKKMDAGGGSTCKTSCAEDDCGPIFDRCTGDMLDCGGCDDGEMCGALRPSKCDKPKPTECVAKKASEVCGSKCGSVSDGCNSVIMCNADNGGVTCQSNQLCVNSACTDAPPSCVPQTCAQLNHQCGLLGDGCGNPLVCPTCPMGQMCKYDSAGNTCVAQTMTTCTPVAATTACSGTCGIVGDGCGSQIDCEADSATACPNGETCGGGGEPGKCGTGSMSCQPIPVATACAGKCGSQSDGCGGAYACDSSNGGQTCDTANGESCGGGGVANQCGKPPCVALTQTQACPGSPDGKSCGVQPDGCGHLLDCGGCTQDQQCGLNQPSICGALPVCQPTPAATVCAGKCGSMPDGCGGTYQCSSSNGGVTCTGSEYCGANGVANTCGIPPVSCMPKTCAQLGHTCGRASDGCGHVLDCWPGCDPASSTCTGDCGSTATCLADPSTGAQTCVSGGPTCSGSLCGSVPTTCTTTQTTLTGTVRTPGRLENSVYVNQLPVPNALVYIPAESTVVLPDIFEGVQAGNTASCGRCADEKLVPDGQSILAAAVTDYKGEFTLSGRVPVGVAFKLVVKVGKWRRVVSVPSGNSVACDTRALASDYTRLAASSTDGLTGTHLPKVAVSTGDVDAMECVLRGMGIADSEFTVPSGTGRIQMYRANGTKMPGTTCTGTYGGAKTSCAANNNYGCVNNKSGCAWNDISVADTTLYASQAAVNAYDMVVFDCEGTGHYIRGATPLSYILGYANNGGRVFASHWSYEWLDNNGTLDMASLWTNTGSATTGIGFISLPSGNTMRTHANPVKSLLYRNWLDYQGALTGTTAGQLTQPATPQMNITDPRDVAGSDVGASSDEWMYRDNSGAKVQQLSFNTPYGAADDQICGRVAFSAFHVAASSSGTTLSTKAMNFPNECHTGVLTPQEKTLAFMLFDLGACVSTGDPPQPPACVAKTANDLCPGVDDACGFISDGCGGVIDCAGCSSANYCDGNICRPKQCAPASCSSYGYTCGDWPDGCGGTAFNSQGMPGCGTCADGQTCGLTSPGICGGCVKISMSTACPTNSCGTVSDGCGGTWDCGICQTGFCGGGGANRCGQNTCTPLTQMAACPNAKSCGLVADGCGGTINCGTCTSPDTCGGGGAPNICGHPTCTPKTVQDACNGLSCGWVSDGCGGAINCGTCANGGVCGGNGPNKCGDTCSPTSCSAEGAECGSIGDKCGGLINCGPCPTGQTCGAMSPNKCGTGTTCTKRTCNQAGAQCGLIGDGCGGALDCGSCTAPQTCGGAGVANQCGQGTTGCNKLTCSGQSVQCGAASDGCGGLLDCGACNSGSFCQNGMCMPALF